MTDFFLNATPPDPRPPEMPPNEPVIPPSEDPARPSIPEELPPPSPDPSPNDSPPLQMHMTQAQSRREVGGRSTATSAGLEETRFGDWEANGKCVDF